MFVVGIGSLGWMLALAAVMAAEKNLPWGRRLRTPLGLALLAWAGAIVFANTWRATPRVDGRSDPGRGAVMAPRRRSSCVAAPQSRALAAAPAAVFRSHRARIAP